MKFKDIFLAPNLITLTRLLVVIYLFFNLTPDNFQVVPLIIIISIIGLSDSLDGVVARRYNLVSKLGIILDPFTDRIVFILLIFWIRDILPTYFLIGIFVREVLILFGSVFVLISKREIKVTKKGKFSTVLMFVIICLQILNTSMNISYINELTLLAIIIYFYVALEYLYILLYKHGQSH